MEIADGLSWQGPAEPLPQLSQLWVPGATSFGHVHKLQREEVVWVLLLVLLADNPGEIALCSVISSLSPSPSPAVHHWRVSVAQPWGKMSPSPVGKELICFASPVPRTLGKASDFWAGASFKGK